jgi:general secretion pathway protein K
MKKNQGVALITVLVIVFIVMAIITSMTVHNYRTIRRLTNQKIMDQSYSILLAAIDFARAGLATSAATSATDSLTDIWAQPIPKTKVLDDIQMSGYIQDEQGKFNINDLVSNGVVNQTVLAQFTNLLSYLNIPSGVASNIAYYMASPQNQSSIIQQYTMANPAYRPAGRPLTDLSELLLVKGMQPSWIYKLNQYVTAIPVSINYQSLNNQESSAESQSVNSGQIPLPSGTGTILVNINTASPEVISAKSGIPLPIAQRMVTLRTTTVFKSQQDITTFLASNGIMLSQNTQNRQSTNTIKPNTLTTASNYFTVHAVVDSGDYEFKWVALVYRSNRSGQWPQVLWQHPE